MSTLQIANPFAGLVCNRPRTYRSGFEVRIESRALTDREQRVLEYMRAFHAQNDQLPPAATIADHFGWASANAANETLIALAKKGAIERNAVGKWRFARAQGVAA